MIGTSAALQPTVMRTVSSMLFHSLSLFQILGLPNFFGLCEELYYIWKALTLVRLKLTVEVVFVQRIDEGAEGVAHHHGEPPQISSLRSCKIRPSSPPNMCFYGSDVLV